MNHLAESDARPLHLCPVDLHKLEWSIGFDVVERYRRLSGFDHQAGLEDEAEWLDKRVGFIMHTRDQRQGLTSPSESGTLSMWLFAVKAS